MKMEIRREEDEDDEMKMEIREPKKKD